jgi:hypothetical protein
MLDRILFVMLVLVAAFSVFAIIGTAILFTGEW